MARIQAVTLNAAVPAMSPKKRDLIMREPTRSDRGFLHWPEIRDKCGARIKVSQSSVDPLGEYMLVAIRDGREFSAVLLTRPQMRSLIESLEAAEKTMDARG